MSWSKTEEQEFVKILFAMGELFNETVSAMRAEMTCRALEDLQFEDVRVAASAHVRASTFFPKPAELRQLVLGNVEDEAELRWQWLLHEIRRVGYLGTPTWPDDVTEYAAEGLFGSWRALCERLPAEGPELLGFRKQFLALFGATSRQAIAGELGPSKTAAAAVLKDVTDQLRARGLPAGKASSMFTQVRGPGARTP
jgi:hypothetical protein